MGCCFQCKRQQESEDTIAKLNQNGFKRLFYSTSEFDLSRSDSEDEEENYSLNSVKNNKQPMTNKIFSISNGLHFTNNTSSTTVNNAWNNRIAQTDD